MLSALVLILSISMPINIDQELINELVKRQIADDGIQKRFAPEGDKPAAEQTTMSPALVAALGAAADGAATYRFLKKGNRGEQNAMWGAIENKPAAVGLAGASLGIGSALLGQLLKKKLPHGLVDALVANLGARQATFAGVGFDDSSGDSGFGSANRLLNVSRTR